MTLEWLQYPVALVFAVLGLACVLLVIIQLPGTWVMLGLALVVEWTDRLYLPADHRQTFDWWVLLGCLGLAVIGEIVEFVAGMVGARKGGSTARGMWGALIGGIVGVFVFTPLFVVIPLLGPLLGTFFGAVLGTFVGALIGELSAEHATLDGSMRPAIGATIGRVIGTTSKVGIAAAMWLVLTVSAFWP